RSEQRLHAGLHRRIISLGDQATADPRLVGHHQYRPTVPLQTRYRRRCSGKQLYRLRISGIILIDDDRPVPIEKGGRPLLTHPAVMWKPASTYIVSPVTALDRSEARKSAALPTSSDSI